MYLDEEGGQGVMIKKLNVRMSKCCNSLVIPLSVTKSTSSTYSHSDNRAYSEVEMICCVCFSILNKKEYKRIVGIDAELIKEDK